MQNNLTELVFILDRSGSMAGLEDDTIGGFNSMLEKQKNGQGRALVTTVLFDHETLVLHDRADLAAVAPLTRESYCVRGSTALLDALGWSIHHIGVVHKYARKEDVPQRTLFVVITDGMENASRRYTVAQVKDMIEHEKRKYGWEFLFLGANIDAVETAARFGIAPDRAVTYRGDSKGTRLNYKAVNEAVTHMRTCAAPLPADWKVCIERDNNERK